MFLHIWAVGFGDLHVAGHDWLSNKDVALGLLFTTYMYADATHISSASELSQSISEFRMSRLAVRHIFYQCGIEQVEPSSFSTRLNMSFWKR